MPKNRSVCSKELKAKVVIKDLEQRKAALQTVEEKIVKHHSFF